MPILSLGLGLDGRPVIELSVSVSSAEREACLEEGRPIPPPISVPALIDTGAGRTHVDLGTLARLAIESISSVAVSRASGGPPESRRGYLVDLSLAGDGAGALAFDLEVIGSPLADGLRVGALLGRDILAHGVLTYDGIGQRLILACNPTRPGL